MTLPLTTSASTSTSAAPPQRYLAVTPDTMLAWLLGCCPDPDSLAAGERHCLSRALQWLAANPWELKKCKSRRTQRNVVRHLCFVTRPDTSVLSQAVAPSSDCRTNHDSRPRARRHPSRLLERRGAPQLTLSAPALLVLQSSKRTASVCTSPLRRRMRVNRAQSAPAAWSSASSCCASLPIPPATAEAPPAVLERPRTAEADALAGGPQERGAPPPGIGGHARLQVHGPRRRSKRSSYEEPAAAKAQTK